MIDTQISGIAGSDCVAAGPVEARTLAQSQGDAAMADFTPQGDSVGDVLPSGSAYTPSGDTQARPGPRG
jgi:hypothetical protein